MLRSTGIALVLVLASLSQAFASDLPIAALASPPRASEGSKAHSPADSTVGVWWGSQGGTGTSVLVEDGRSLVVSCYHVVPSIGAEVMIYTPTGIGYHGRTVAGDYFADVVAIVVEGVIPPTPLADEEVPIGTEVYHHGRGSGGGAGQRCAVPKPIGGDIWVHTSSHFATTMACRSGDSGAGVFDRARGRLVGMVAGTFGAAGPNIQRGSPLTPIRNVVGRAVNFMRSPLQGRSQAAPAVIPKTPMAQVDPPKADPCPGGVCPVPSSSPSRSSERWYPGKFLGRR